MKRVFVVALFAFSDLGLGQATLPGPGGTGYPAKYDVVWDSPSSDHTGSMPIGNGDVTLNAWVEESGDLLFYIGKSDSWEDNGRLAKVGRMRISLVPRSKMPLRMFQQTLSLVDGTIRVRSGEGADAVRLVLWVDANHPVIHVEAESGRPTIAVASIENWRSRREVLPSIEISDVLFDQEKENKQHGTTTVEPDSVFVGLRGRIGWYHHNVKSVGPGLCATIQGLGKFKRTDPLLHRIFGALVAAENAERIDDTHLRSRSSNRHAFSICVLTGHPSTRPQWLRATENALEKSMRIPFHDLRQAHDDWWMAFWNRSWIHITPKAEGDSLQDEAYLVSRAYALQRFINACAGRGRYPIKFNGTLFTVPYPGRPGDADYRQWGPGYWWQNTRLPYHSMCASGDFDLMTPLFQMYGKDLMPLFRYRTRLYLNHDGAFIPECIYFWGDVFSETYGWTPFEKRADKLQESRWHKWEWVSGLELVWLMLDYYEHTLDLHFLRDMALPAAYEVLTFFDQQYKTGPDGKLVMHPSQALETWWECTNPMPEIAGLHATVDRLLSLPRNLTSTGQREFWTRLQKKLPSIPERVVGGKRMLAPAEKFERKQNIENPELYAVFPFRLVGLNKPKKELAVEAFTNRVDRGDSGWRQDDIFAAYLGLGDTVRNYVVGRARNKNAESRFPAFWGPNYDWVPDQDHGSILLKALQAMVMQADGGKIYLLPAWPTGWNVDFKLHAPDRTIVEGSFIDGKLVKLRVTPIERSGSVVNCSLHDPG